MKEKPILFSAPMVKAILEGRKTMTRRLTGLDEVNDRSDIWCFIEEEGIWQFVSQLGSVVSVECPYGQVGDSLSVYCYERQQTMLELSSQSGCLPYRRFCDVQSLV